MTSNAELFETVIGLEVHCQLAARSKLFCGCSTASGAEPNSQVCPVCLGLPGSLPVVNAKAVELAIRFGLAVGAQIDRASTFARKQYFYPDLPKGYQISQFQSPICVGGVMSLPGGGTVRLTRAHLEEDAGKSIHKGTQSLIDLNRAGTPLLEIVSEPDIRKGSDAVEYLKALRVLVRHIEISDGNLEEGSFRCDVNVSLRPVGAARLGTKCEIKNLNSFRNVERAIATEVKRQAGILAAGGHVVQETLLYDAERDRTIAMRSKEDAHDYRYFPDPDLRPLTLADDLVATIASSLPELPQAMALRFQSQYGLSVYDAGLLAADRDLSTYFEAVSAMAGVSPKTAANWLISELQREVNERGGSWSKPPVPAARLGQLLVLLAEGKVAGRTAKEVLVEMIGTGEAPGDIIRHRGVEQLSDEGALRSLVDRIVSEYPEQAAAYLAGNAKILAFLVGKIMKECQGRANPTLVNRLIQERLARH